MSPVLVGALAGLALAVSGAVVRPAAEPPAGAGPALTGQLLVASEELSDPRFARTVVYMVQHDTGGAMGLVVNRPLGDVPLARLLARFGLDTEGIQGSVRVHYGGPVEPARGVVLHTAEYAGRGTEIIGGGVAVTSQPGILLAIASGAGPRRALFVAGYDGWAPGQLEEEMRAGAWVTVPADEELIFGGEPERKWERAFARRRIRL